MACVGIPPASGFVGSVTGYIDCQAQTLGSGAWSALAAPGSTLTVLLTGFLTIFIALIGYNLLLGRSITVRDGTLAFVKIGVVFAFATSWPVYRTLVYDLVTSGPAQLVSEVGPRAGVIGSDGTLTQRLDATDHALGQLAMLGAGTPPPGSGIQAPPPPFGGFDAFALGGSKILFLLTAVASLAAVRIVTGLMLALGPFFIAFIMFDSTRSLFEGWLRVIGGAALAAIGVSMTLGLELALIEPWLSGVLARRMAGEALPTMPSELFVLVALFTIIVLASLYACLRVTRAFTLYWPSRLWGEAADPAESASSRHGRVIDITGSTAREAERSRAAAIASTLVATTRRESLFAGPEQRTMLGTDRASVTTRNAEPAAAVVPVGRTHTRRVSSRVSASAARRDDRQ